MSKTSSKLSAAKLPRIADLSGRRKRRRDTAVRGDEKEVERPRKRAMPAPSALRRKQTEERQRRIEEEMRAQKQRLEVEKRRLMEERRKNRMLKKEKEEEEKRTRANVRRRSDRSVDMSESEGSVPPTASKYPIEGKFKSEKDREEINALPEIQRESILADRADEMQKEDESRRLKALFQSYKDTTKRKADEADLRETGKSSRVKTQKEQRLDELRRKREERDVKRAGQSSRVRRSTSPDADGDGESEPEFENIRRERTPEESPITLRDFELIKVGYNNLAKVCFYPHFDHTMVGCYVRLPHGNDPNHKQYRMARIEEVVERHPYAIAFASGNGRKFITTQHLVVTIGKSRREVPFIFCSQGAFSPQELDSYLSTLREENLSVPKRSHLINKNADINALIGHNFTDKELSAKVNMSNVLQQRYREHKRSMLQKDKEQAESNEELASTERISRQLQTVMTDPLNLRYNTSMPQSSSGAGGAGGSSNSTHDSPSKKSNAPAQQTQQQRLAQMNRERAKDDQQRIRKALLEEKRVAANRHKAALAAAAAARETLDPTAETGATAAAATNVATSKDDGPKKAVKMVNGKPVHNLFSATDDLELPHPEWCFNYVEYSNKYLGSRSMRHLSYDDKGRAITEWPREMTEDEVIARMDIPGMPPPEY